MPFEVLHMPLLLNLISKNFSLITTAKLLRVQICIYACWTKKLYCVFLCVCVCVCVCVCICVCFFFCFFVFYFLFIFELQSKFTVILICKFLNQNKNLEMKKKLIQYIQSKVNVAPTLTKLQKKIFFFVFLVPNYL